MDSNKIGTLTIGILLLFVLYSCSKESSGLKDAFEDQIIQVDENIETGSLIGTVKKSLADDYVFTIENQDPEGALSINAVTGALLVSDELLFDYEKYPEINLTVKAANASGSNLVEITIQLNDLDDIFSFFGASKEAYSNATDGEWITVTEDEYKLLAERIVGVVKSGTTDSQYATEESTSWEATDATLANYSVHNIPADHQLFAFKYYATEDDTEGVEIKISLADVSPAFVSLPAKLPSHGMGDQFFVLKGGSDPAIRELRLGMYTPKGGIVVIEPGLESELLFSPDNAAVFNQFPPQANSLAKYQGLSTDIVQWD